MPIPPVVFDRHSLFLRGKERVKRFCELNNLPIPSITDVDPAEWYVSSCAYYRPEPIGIQICLAHCGFPAGKNYSRNWTWPGSDTDREPFGVLCHELGHHVDLVVSLEEGFHLGSYGGGYSVRLRALTKDKPISGYCDNDWEWFAEIFRLFVTNHALLRALRPVTYEVLRQRFLPVSRDNWVDELGPNVPKRIVQNLLKKTRGNYEGNR